MSDPRGFLKYDRKVPAPRPPVERSKDWDEIVQRAKEAREIEEQASRCMNCGVPFCQTGEELDGKTSGCPVENLIPDFNNLVSQGLWKEALDVLLSTNNFPEFTGKACPAPCEGSCVVAINQPAVTIKQVELEIIEKGFEEGWIKPNPPERRSGKKVAVIGSGPAGLACADDLNKKGHEVTVIEREDRAGGLLMYGIPNMKLDKKIVNRRLDLMKDSGIKFSLGCEVGKDISATDLNNEYDAVVLCCGATLPRDLEVPGRKLKGVHFAMDFLTPSTKSLLGDKLKTDISAQGKDVIVIGGGDTGTDCVATSLRQKCRSIQQLEIRPKPPEIRGVKNPWPEWPDVYFLDYGQQEEEAIHGKDPRHYQALTLEFKGKNGKLESLVTQEIEWKDGGFQVIEGTEKERSCQMALLALGYVGPEPIVLEDFNIASSDEVKNAAPFEKYKTSKPGVFWAGDMRRGQSLIVWAIQEGQEAAKICDDYLNR